MALKCKTILSFCLTALLPMCVSAKEVDLATLLDSASKNSLSLKVRQSDIGIETSRLDSVKSDYYPVVSLSYNNEYNRDLKDGAGGVESVGDTVITNGTRYQSSLSLNMNYELYHFGTTQRKVGIAEKEIAIKRWQWCEEENRLHQKILEHYTSALKSDVTIEEQKKILDIRRKVYDHKERLHAAGKYSKFDLGNEAIEIIDLERSIERSRLQYDNDLIALTQLSHIELTEEDTLLPLDISIDDTKFETSFVQTAEGARIEEQLRQKHDEIIMHDRSRLPAISFYSNYYLYGSDTEDVAGSLEALRRSSWKAGVGLRWTIYEGFRFDSDMRRLKLEMQKLRDERDELERMYEYERKMKQSRIMHLESLQQSEAMAIRQSETNIDMAKRLRDHAQIVSIDALMIDLEGIKRHLSYTVESIDHDYEKALLDMMSKGADQCSLL